MANQITIISGKGGTGKTTLSAALAAQAANNAIFADVDVDAPDLHLILQPEKLEEEKLYLTKKVHRKEELCTRCGLCEEKCRFNAITTTEINFYKCEGCGLCPRICPEDALYMKEYYSASVFHSKTRFGHFTHAEMAIGEGNSGKIVSSIRKKAQKLAEDYSKEYIIIDGSPGIGCPVIASITGVDLVLIIVEPTLSGIHDLERVLGVTQHFEVPAMVCINKYDLNKQNTKDIETFCKKNNINIIGKIPFTKVVPKSIIEQKSIMEMDNEEIKKIFQSTWQNIQKYFH
ncbi:MAG: ATP-binding protein [Asgard group archaeon]|nr:ATP-binding protein [Asgard group archaeon]